MDRNFTSLHAYVATVAFANEPSGASSAHLPLGDTALMQASGAVGKEGEPARSVVAGARVSRTMPDTTRQTRKEAAWD